KMCIKFGENSFSIFIRNCYTYKMAGFLIQLQNFRPLCETVIYLSSRLQALSPGEAWLRIFD
uniref:Uncharacterized protein n=1 Tax=Strix occidentalis caurina TaxID=311401 RepID=A0A8D0EKS8_STROC